MRRWIAFFASAVLAGTTLTAFAQDNASQAISQLPRNETLILENPQGTIRNASWFNIWVPAGGGLSTGLQQLGMDTLWYIDPESGIDGAWYDSLAAEPPKYNAGFSEMTVKLRDGIYWSDDVKFTAADVVYTVETQMKTPGMTWGPAFNATVEKVEAPDDLTVVFRLKKPNARFHSIFSVRWNAAWIMPKHVFEKAGNPIEFKFDPPVSLGPYVLKSYDPNGAWYVWERRQDWQRTTIAQYGEPAPRYVVYRDGGPSDRRVIALQNGDLDVIHDIAPEGMFALAKSVPTARGWFKGFPYAHPDPTLPSVLFNQQKPLFQDKRVRWALALLIDIRAVSMASYRGAATISAIAIPPTGTHPKDYHEPLEAWLAGFELDTGKQKIKPYDPNASLQIAQMLKPSMGDAIPADEAAVKRSFGRGWWKQNPQAAAELLESAGFRKQGDQWMTPDGQPFRIRLMVEGDARPIMTRAGTMIAQNWRQFGIDAATVVSGPQHADRQRMGDYDASMGWSIETWGGHPDLSFFLDSWHSQFVAKPGESQPPRNWQRWTNPELDKIIEQIRTIDFNDPKNVELGREYAKLMVEEMPIIPVMAYNVFTVVNEKYWTGFPTAENPYGNPVPNWSNTKYIMSMIKPAAN